MTLISKITVMVISPCTFIASDILDDIASYWECLGTFSLNHHQNHQKYFFASFLLSFSAFPTRIKDELQLYKYYWKPINWIQRKFAYYTLITSLNKQNLLTFFCNCFILTGFSRSFFLASSSRFLQVQFIHWQIYYKYLKWHKFIGLFPFLTKTAKFVNLHMIN